MQTAANKAQTLDEILGKQPSLPPPSPELAKMKGKNYKGTGDLIHTADDIKRAIARARRETAVDDASYYLQGHLGNISTLFGGDQLTVGGALDDAITHYLAGVKAELGAEICEQLALLLICNIALFAPKQCEAIVKAATA